MASLEGKLVESWLSKLNVEELSAQSPSNANNYADIVAAKGGSIDAATLRTMFVVDDVPQFDAFDIIYNALDVVEQKFMKKVPTENW